ncbi:octapeptide-repeat protein T2-like [Chamaea fasciata]|uniref:octapeptide-repeat protein T2-like n=1 Tax=Chamaea fasciata TaxID=190680 RepID=UPI00336ABB37
MKKKKRGEKERREARGERRGEARRGEESWRLCPPSRSRQALRRRSELGLQAAAPSGGGRGELRRREAGAAGACRARRLTCGGRKGGRPRPRCAPRPRGSRAGAQSYALLPPATALDCSGEDKGGGWCCREQGPRGTDRVERRRREREGGKEGGREAGKKRGREGVGNPAQRPHSDSLRCCNSSTLPVLCLDMS